MLGEFEYLLLAATVRLGRRGVWRCDPIGNREFPRGRTARLERFTRPWIVWKRRGLIETWMGSATRHRGGRSKRMVRITARGIKSSDRILSGL